MNGTFTDTFTTEKPVHIYSFKASPGKSTRPVIEKKKKSSAVSPKPKVYFSLDRPVEGPALNLKGVIMNPGKKSNQAAMPLIKIEKP